MNPSSAIGGILVSGGPFDTVTGLPVHALIVHVAVVLLPLSALALITLVLVPRWRRTFIWVTLAGLLIGTGAAFVAKESGQALAARVGNPIEHSRWGDVLPLIALLLVVVAALWFWLERRAAKSNEGSALTRGSALVTVAGLASIALALMSIIMTVIVGHTGAQAVWQEQVAPAKVVASDAQVIGPAAVSAANVYSLADVAAHNQKSDCWSDVNGTVYDLTPWIRQHPGGPEVITQVCGVDASPA